MTEERTFKIRKWDADSDAWEAIEESSVRFLIARDVDTGNEDQTNSAYCREMRRLSKGLIVETERGEIIQLSGGLDPDDDWSLESERLALVEMALKAR